MSKQEEQEVANSTTMNITSAYRTKTWAEFSTLEVAEGMQCTHDAI
jgi:hypothetical protein